MEKWPLNAYSTQILVRDYAHYAEAAYGYALFLYKNSNCRGALKLRNMTCLLNFGFTSFYQNSEFVIRSN